MKTFVATKFKDTKTFFLKVIDDATGQKEYEGKFTDKPEIVRFLRDIYPDHFLSLSNSEAEERILWRICL